jgi:diacylglycerol kinase family enzyme
VEHGIPQNSDPVVVVGGDGTIRAVIKALLGRNNPLVILPGGSANNIAHSLGLGELSIPEIIAHLDKPVRHSIDLGRIDFPWGESEIFVEGIGFGLFADGLAAYDTEKGKSFQRGLQTAFENLTEHATYRVRMKIDGEPIEAEYKLVEVLNTARVGPGLPFSPKARMTDGKLRVVFMDAAVPATSALIALLARRLESVEGIETQKGELIEIEWNGFKLHVDRYIYPDEATRQAIEKEPLADRMIEIKVLPKAINLWFPNLSDEE